VTIEIREEPPSALSDYARVPIAFEVRERFTIYAPDAGLAGLHLLAERVAVPYVKDYDADPLNHPTAWPHRFDLSHWGILAAYAGGTEHVGGVVVAWGAAAAELMENRADLAVLWDLRVAPHWRGRGVGAALFEAAEAWALTRGARWLKVETQSVNVAACRLYVRQGCTLGAVHRFAYPTLPDEAQLLWYKLVTPRAPELRR
jgi:GNAT superfamily N-acetyltransferase